MPYVIPCPDPLLGEHLTTITICKLKRSTTTPGTWEQDGAPVSITAYVRRTEHSEDTGARDIRPVNSKRLNYNPLTEGEGMTIGCLARSEDENAMNFLWRGCPLKRFEVGWIEGVESMTGRFTGGRRQGGISDYGENLIEWTLLPMDDGSNTPNVTVINTTEGV